MAVSKEITSRLGESYQAFEDGIKGFFSKEIAPKDFKGIGGGYGSYAEKGFNSAMLRLRVPAGRIKTDKMKFLLRMIAELNLPFVHFTTGENLQFHQLQGEQILSLYKAAFDEGWYSRGSGGDHFRNVTASPLRGVHPEEMFDITPYVEAASDYALSLVDTIKLPRKYKCGFSSVDNDGHATFKEMGFLAKDDGTFDVYAAGGIGGGSRFGVKVAEQVAPSDILYHMKAMANLYHEHGNFQNRGKARARFIALEMGNEAFVALYQEYLVKVKAAEDLSFEVVPNIINKKGDTSEPTSTAFKQKQEGLYYVHYKPLAGTPPMAVFVELLTYLSDLEEVEIRINSDESIYIINLTGAEADVVNRIIADTKAQNRFEESVACVGSTICQIGFQDSSGMLKTVVETLAADGVSTDHLPKIHVSGCPSSCGTHQIGHIGLHGFTKLVDKKPQPAFKLFVGGEYEATKERLAKEIGVLAISDIPAFFKDLAIHLNEIDEDFEVWYPTHEEDFVTIAKPYL